MHSTNYPLHVSSATNTLILCLAHLQIFKKITNITKKSIIYTKAVVQPQATDFVIQSVAKVCVGSILAVIRSIIHEDMNEVFKYL